MKQAERVECCGNPIAESLWPTCWERIPPGPFHRVRVHGRTALKKRSLKAPRSPRRPCNLLSACGLPVSACSLTLVLPGAIHPDLAGEMLELNALVVRTLPGCTRGELEIRRPGSHARYALVNEPAHADIHRRT